MDYSLIRVDIRIKVSHILKSDNMTKYVIDWLKNVHPELDDTKISEINKFFDMKYYSMLKNGSTESTANNSAWEWVESIFFGVV